MLNAELNRLRSNIFLKPVLFLSAAGYGLVVRIRNILFDRRILRVRKFDPPVISVGNISAGGSGKTPFTMELIRLLSRRFKRIAVISRGYKRKSRGLQVVSDGQGFVAGIETGGDEPVLIARRFPQCVVLVSEKRSRAVEQAAGKFQCDLIIMDDAFQHRWVERDADIVLLNSSGRLSPGRLLPAGNLREPPDSLKRADLVMLIGKETNQPVGAPADLPQFFQGYSGSCRRQVDCWVDAGLNQVAPPHGRPVVAFAGIADPDSFSKLLQAAGLELRRLIIYPDHHNYTEEDCKYIRLAAREEKCSDLVTTEKDLVKLKAGQFNGLNLAAPRIRICLEQALQFQQKLYEFIDKT